MHGRQMKVRARSVLSHTLQRFGAQRFLWQAENFGTSEGWCSLVLSAQQQKAGNSMA